jgi:hypothetical protein
MDPTKPYDFNDVEIKVGDTVIVAVSDGNSFQLMKGEVMEITSPTQIKILKERTSDDFWLGVGKARTYRDPKKIMVI